MATKTGGERVGSVAGHGQCAAVGRYSSELDGSLKLDTLEVGVDGKAAIVVGIEHGGVSIAYGKSLVRIGEGNRGGLDIAAVGSCDKPSVTHCAVFAVARAVEHAECIEPPPSKLRAS